MGGGIMVAIAAGLWLLYLLPSWFKRREYVAAERMQQTARILETTERSAAMNVEAPKLVEAPRLVDAPAPKRRTAPGPVAVGRAVVLPTPVAEDSRALAASRLRRTRAITTLVLFLAAVIAVVQLGLIVGTGAVAASWIILSGAGLAVVSSVAMLGRLAEVSRRRRVEPERAARRTSLGHAPAAVRVKATAQPWTPVAMPKPLYLSHSVDAPTIAAAVQLERDRIEAAAELLRAAAAAEEALRAVQATAPPLRPGERSFASMGIVDDDAASAPDLDAMLARRRAVG